MKRKREWVGIIDYVDKDGIKLYEDAMKELIFANSKKPFAKEVQE